MAYFDVQIPKDFIDALYRLENSDDKIRRMLDKAIPIVENAVEREISARHTDSGEMLDSLKVFGPMKNDDGVWEISVSPSGKTSNKKRSGPKVYARSKHGTKTSGKALFNDDKLWWIEYGNSKQPARPFLTKVAKDCEPAVLEKMQEVFNEEMGK